MKPEKGLDEMDEKVYDPREMFAEVGLLITEARTPDLSRKGRVEGPHCPPLKGNREHECDRHKQQCRKASDLLSFQEILWQNKIPMRIDVLLFPNCEHGYREETVIEGASFNCMDNFELLERWDVQLVKKRSPEKLEGFVSGRIHLQAVRSYLHFSQLSSWLISVSGAIPFRVVYRIYAPGEAVGYTFGSLPEVHNFPSAELANVVMRSTVAHLPRQDKFMTLFCRSQSPSIEQHLRNKKMGGEDIKHRTSPLTEFNDDPQPSTSKCQVDYDTLEMNKYKTKSNLLHDYGRQDQQQIKQKPPIGRKTKDDNQSKSRTGPCPMSKTPKRKVDQLSPTMKYAYEFPSETERQNSKCETITSSQNITCEALISNVKQVAVTTKLSVIQTPSISCQSSSVKKFSEYKTPEKITHTKVHPYRKLATLSVSTNNAFIGSKRLPSPKVLVTGSKKPEPTDFKKRCLDLNLQENSESSDNFVGLKPLDEITSDDLNDLIKPLSPSDLEAYLTSLSNKAPKKFGASKLDDIPTTKCSFYLGESDSSYLEERSSKEPKELVTNLKDVTPAIAQSLSYDSSIEHKMQHSPPKSKEESHIRKLFTNSLQQKDSNTVQHENSSEHNSSLINMKANYPSTGEQGLENLIYKKTVSSVNKTDHEKSETNSYFDLHTHESLSREATASCSSENTTDISRKTTPRSSKRDLTLAKLSIPCSVGGNNTAMSSLVHNLESMDIDENCQQSNLSSSVDNEVENHLKKELFQNGFNESKREPSQVSEEPAENCDTSPNRDLSLCKQLLKREFQQNVKNEMLTHSNQGYKSLPSPEDIKQFQFVMGRSASAVFNASTGLPSRSSPAPVKKNSSTRFDYDCSLTNVRAIKNAISCSKLTLQSEDNCDTIEDPKILSTSAPASTNCLLGNFEESVLNGRIEPVGVVEGFTVEIGAGGTFCPKHVTLPVIAYFFQLSDDNAPSPYLGYVNLEPLGKRGYHIPRTGTVQVTLFNPNKTVVKMFVVMYDLSDMPANCQTFLRQRTMYTPVDTNSTDPSYLRYLIHLRFQSSKSGKIYLHTDIRLIFARDKFEFDPQVANYELRSFTEGPENPKFSPKR